MVNATLRIQFLYYLRQNWGSYSRFAAQEAQITLLPWEAKTEWFWQFRKHHALCICNGVIILWSIFYLSLYWECYSQFAIWRPHFPSTCKRSYFWTFEGSVPCRFSFQTTCTTFYSILSSIGWDTVGLLKILKMNQICEIHICAFSTAYGCNIIYSLKSPGPEGLAWAFKLSSQALNHSLAWLGFLGFGLAQLGAFRPGLHITTYAMLSATDCFCFWRSTHCTIPLR